MIIVLAVSGGERYYLCVSNRYRVISQWKELSSKAVTHDRI